MTTSTCNETSYYCQPEKSKPMLNTDREGPDQPAQVHRSGPYILHIYIICRSIYFTVATESVRPELFFIFIFRFTREPTLWFSPPSFLIPPAPSPPPPHPTRHTPLSNLVLTCLLVRKLFNFYQPKLFSDFCSFSFPPPDSNFLRNLP